MKHFYLKELISNPYIIGGAPVPFEHVDDNRGVIALDDSVLGNSTLITGLDEAAAAGRGGIVKISEADYAKKKSERSRNLLSMRSKQNSRADEIRVMPSVSSLLRKRGAAGAADTAAALKPAAPAEKPSPKFAHLAEKAKAFKPAVGKAIRVSQPAG